MFYIYLYLAIIWIVFEDYLALWSNYVKNEP